MEAFENDKESLNDAEDLSKTENLNNIENINKAEDSGKTEDLKNTPEKNVPEKTGKTSGLLKTVAIGAAAASLLSSDPAEAQVRAGMPHGKNTTEFVQHRRPAPGRTYQHAPTRAQVRSNQPRPVQRYNRPIDYRRGYGYQIPGHGYIDFRYRNGVMNFRYHGRWCPYGELPHDLRIFLEFNGYLPFIQSMRTPGRTLAPMAGSTVIKGAIVIER